MRVDWEKSSRGRRWSVETTGAIDRAVAGLVTVVALVITQLIGLPSELLHLAARVM